MVLQNPGTPSGEGFDHAPLDTLLLALPVSWQGTVRQYAGRLHRVHPDKHDVRIYDYVDADVPVLARRARAHAFLWPEPRRRGYRQVVGGPIADGQPVA
jgi:hypothetical protein